MLKGNNRTKLNHLDLIKKIDEQRHQIADYENKLKDLIRAYKGLSAEKNALQEAIKALDLHQETTTSVEKSQTNVQSEASSPEMNAEEKMISKEDQIETLKRSLGVLIAEKSRLEAAFRSDRKALLMENETLKERLTKAATETEAQAEKLESRMLELRSKIKLIEGDREKELSDHGSVLAAIQQQYAKECASSGQLEKQNTELHQKLREKEKAFKLLEADIVILKEELSRTQSEVKFWQKRAEKTPAIQVLESELQDIKESSKNEITELKRKLTETMNTERENRLHELEQRLQEMSIEVGNFNKIRSDLQHKIDQLEEKNMMLENENAILESSKSVKETDDESTSFESLKENFIKIVQKLRDSKQKINFYELLGLEEISHEQKRRYEILKNEFEKYKLKTQAVLKSKSMNSDILEDRELSHTLSLLSVSECSYCATAEGDLRHMRTTVASLHDKLQCLEIDHANAKKSYEEKITQLQFKITEMEVAQEKSAADLRNQMYQRVAEMESEMQKQRTRALNILAEKENELEITKGILASVRNQSNVDPVDPPQDTSFRPIKLRKNRSRDTCESDAPVNERRRSAEIGNATDHSVSDIDSCSSVVDEHHLECLSTSLNTTQALFASGTTAATETRNIFYEQQLVKKEKQIIELRNAMHIAELSVRDIQQATLTKDLQHFEMVEKLKDEIRILEGKLKFLSTDSNMEYLRNIFIQLLYCDNSSRRKHILKAIGAVLKLSVNEMRAIEKRNL